MRQTDSRPSLFFTFISLVVFQKKKKTNQKETVHYAWSIKANRVRYVGFSFGQQQLGKWKMVNKRTSLSCFLCCVVGRFFVCFLTPIREISFHNQKRKRRRWWCWWSGLVDLFAIFLVSRKRKRWYPHQHIWFSKVSLVAVSAGLNIELFPSLFCSFFFLFLTCFPFYSLQ